VLRGEMVGSGQFIELLQKALRGCLLHGSAFGADQEGGLMPFTRMAAGDIGVN